MAPGGMIAVTTFVLCFILGPLSPVPATCSQMSRACCTRYNRKPIPFQRIKGFREQTVKENCHIKAIIFYTVKNNEICATQRDEWVRKTLELLSSKLKKMSKADSATSETPMKRGENPTFNDGSESFLSAAETFFNSTENLY